MLEAYLRDMLKTLSIIYLKDKNSATDEWILSQHHRQVLAGGEEEGFCLLCGVDESELLKLKATEIL